MNKIIFVVALSMLFSFSVMGQELIRGKVVDKDGIPIPGARVSVKGNDSFVLSQFDGSFSIITDATGSSRKLSVDYVGYNSKVVSMDKSSEIVLKKRTIWDDFFVIPSFGVYPQASYGLMLGCVDRFGGYVKYRSDFKGVTITGLREGLWTGECNRNGETKDGYIWATGNYEKNRTQITGGVLMKLTGGLYGYAGTGYGYADVYWEDYFGSWMRVTDLSARGLAAECGLIYQLGPVSLSAGVSTTAFVYSELELGVGVMF